MAQFYEDWSDYADGAAADGTNGGIPGWTPRWWLSGVEAGRVRIAADVRATAGQLMVIDAYTSTRAACAFSLDAADGAEEVEIVTRFLNERTSWATDFYSHGQGTTYTQNMGDTGYFGELYYLSGTTPTDRGRVAKVEAGTATWLSDNVVTGITDNQWWWCRWRRTADGIQRIKWWQDGTAEPADWTVVAHTPDQGLLPGWVGVGFREQPTICWYDIIGVGTAGDPAPTAPVVTVTEVAGTDSGTGTETEETVAGHRRTVIESVGIEDAPVAQETVIHTEDTDTAAGADAAAVTATATDVDAGTGADREHVGTDADKRDTDGGSGTETETVAVDTLPAADTGTGADREAVRFDATGTDEAAGYEAELAAKAIPSDDAATGTDAEQPPDVTLPIRHDTAAAAEREVLDKTLTDTDSAVGVDRLYVAWTSTDSAVGRETETVLEDAILQERDGVWHVYRPTSTALDIIQTVGLVRPWRDIPAVEWNEREGRTTVIEAPQRWSATWFRGDTQQSVHVGRFDSIAEAASRLYDSRAIADGDAATGTDASTLASTP